MHLLMFLYPKYIFVSKLPRIIVWIDFGQTKEMEIFYTLEVKPWYDSKCHPPKAIGFQFEFEN